jgi:hypothetical protein
VDEDLVRTHEQLIVPLLKKRFLFSGVERFVFYDVATSDGAIDENVFAYSNAAGHEKALVIYHNRWGHTAGSIQSSTPMAVRTAGGERHQRRISLGEALALSSDPRAFTTFRDHVTGLTYIRSNQELRERGFMIQAGPYSYQVFLDFAEHMDDDDGTYAGLASYLEGRGTPSLEHSQTELKLRPIHDSLRKLFSPEVIASLQDPQKAHLVEDGATDFFYVAARFTGAAENPAIYAQMIREEVVALLELFSTGSEDALRTRDSGLPDITIHDCWQLVDPVQLLVFSMLRALARFMESWEDPEMSRARFDALRMEWVLGPVLREHAPDESEALRFLQLVKVLVRHRLEYSPPSAEKREICAALRTLLEDGAVRSFLALNEYQGVWWFSKERLERLVCWMAAVLYLEADDKARVQLLETLPVLLGDVLADAETARYRVGPFLSLLDGKKD